MKFHYIDLSMYLSMSTLSIFYLLKIFDNKSYNFIILQVGLMLIVGLLFDITIFFINVEKKK